MEKPIAISKSQEELSLKDYLRAIIKQISQLTAK
jgi:hypothetical protein